MKITFLGTGTSTGVPQIGCHCPVCTSTDPRDRRLRCSALVETDTTRLLIDCGPDFREQMLTRPYRRLDAVLLTHEHYDHVGGIDDLRPYAVFGDVDIYADRLTSSHLQARIPYCFVEHKYPGVPQLTLHTIEPHQAFRLGDIEVMPIRVMHGNLPILGYRLNNLAYLTDLKTLPEEELPYLQGLDTLVVTALRHTPHNTHQTVDDACRLAERLGAPRTYLIHMGHSVGLHAETDAALPEGVHLAYDGLEVEING